ncbi:MAG: AI-2E family transporter [Phycicoccus sp.]|nr:AI-2E family transporter [Phycicoccus sp.]NMM33696.1 AI-2E family transporter [Phycicoccus sp.]
MLRQPLFKRWADFRQRQREILRASNAPTLIAPTPTAPDAGVTPAEGRQTGEQTERDILTDTLPLGAQEPPSRRHDYGTAGRPLNRQSPFYVGLVGAFGVLVAYGLFRALGQLTQVITLLIVAFFMTLALNPLVEALNRRGLRRPASVTIVFVGLVAVFTALGFVVVPPVTQQGGLLADNAPRYLDNLLANQFVQNFDSHYHVLDKVRVELEKLVTDGNFMSGFFGGVLGAGKALASGLLGFLTVLVLTLYFLSSLPKVKEAAYGMVPRSRRPRFMSLSEEIMRRVGSYAIGQVAVATLNAILSWVMMSIVGIRYAAVLAVVVGFLGLIPMVGASLGAAIVCLVAVFDDPTKAVIALVYYIAYQQLENYVIAPRIMQRTVSVPGAVTVIAALAGATLLGILGALLAIPVAAGLLLIYEEVLLPRQHQT